MPIDGCWLISFSLPVAGSTAKALTAPLGLPWKRSISFTANSSRRRVSSSRNVGLGVSAASPSGTSVMFCETSRPRVCSRNT